VDVVKKQILAEVKLMQGWMSKGGRSLPMDSNKQTSAVPFENVGNQRFKKSFSISQDDNPNFRFYLILTGFFIVALPWFWHLVYYRNLKKVKGVLNSFGWGWENDFPSYKSTMIDRSEINARTDWTLESPGIIIPIWWPYLPATILEDHPSRIGVIAGYQNWCALCEGEIYITLPFSCRFLVTETVSPFSFNSWPFSFGLRFSALMNRVKVWNKIWRRHFYKNKVRLHGRNFWRNAWTSGWDEVG